MRAVWGFAVTLDQAKARYGEIVGGKWADEVKWCSLLSVPADIAAAWINTASGKPTTHIYCNRDIQTPLLRALSALQDNGVLHELRTFDGCYMVRDVRGEPGHPSTHSYALAIDVCASENKLGQEPKLSAVFVSCFITQGFTWGGTFHRKDGMHFQCADW